MEHFRLNVLDENDINAIVDVAGGSRAVEDDSRQTELNADYTFETAVVELKLLDEEGLEKRERQQRLAELFKKSQPDTPVVVLDPKLLDENDRRLYYRALEGPIKTHVKKAAKQVDTTSKRFSKDTRVLLAINNGYTALNHNEFVEIVTKCARNDTSRIDVVIAAGVYYYSDTFDYYLFPPIDFIPINDGSFFEEQDAFRDSWNGFIGDKLAATVRGEEVATDLKSPVLDLAFEVDGIKFVKPSPPFGKKSEFFQKGRPRANSTGLTQCPPVAVTFPKLSLECWEQITSQATHAPMLQGTYNDWQSFANEEENSNGDPDRPFVPVEIKFKEFKRWCAEEGYAMNFETLCEYAIRPFQKEMFAMMERAKELSKQTIALPRSIILRTREVGQDRAFDLSSIFMRSETAGFERETPIVRNLNIFFEHGKALAAAYAIKHEIAGLLFEIDKTYGWE